jgi:VRR-NUC domain
MTPARRVLDQALTEEQWLWTVTDLALRLGWQSYHTRDSRRSQPGFPDLVLINERVIFAELKAEGGRLGPWQRHWLKRLYQANAEVYVWRPSDWDEAQRVLRHQGDPMFDPAVRGLSIANLQRAGVLPRTTDTLSTGGRT